MILQSKSYRPINIMKGRAIKMEGIKEVKFDLSKIDLGLSDTARSIIDYFANNIIYICDYIDDYENWIMDDLIMKILHGFEHIEFRTCVVNFRFTHDKTEKTKVTTFRMFIVNCIMWLPQVNVDFDSLNDEMVIPVEDSPKMIPDYVAKYYDRFYTGPYMGVTNEYFLNECLADSIWLLQMYCHLLKNFPGLSMSTEVFINLAKKNASFKELLHTKLDETKQPAELEADAKRLSDIQWNNILTDPDFNMLKPLVATRALKQQQLAEFDVTIPLKPDIEGNTIPYPINLNWLTGEINTIMATFINDISGRKSAIINNEFMGSAGHILILTAIMCIDAKLSKYVEDCHSPNPVPIHIKSKKHLEKLDGRYYRYSGQGDDDYQLLDSTKDSGLIDQTLWFRSPATCCAEDGRICKKCYGKLARLNRTLYSVGAYAAFVVMMEVMQKLLSAKHHQVTTSTMIQFIDAFFELFNLSGTDVVLNIDSPELDTTTLILKRDDIISADTGESISLDDSKGRKRKSKKDSDDDEDGDDLNQADAGSFKLDYYTMKFYVSRNFSNKKNVVVEEMEEKDSKELYIHKDFINRMKFMTHPSLGEIFYIGLDEIDPSEFIFMLETENFELSKPLNSIKKLIDTQAHEGCTSYEDMIQMMLDLIIQAGNSASSLQGEIIIRQLIRDSKLVMKRPDFSRYVQKSDYQLMSVTTALKKHPSITTSMSTPYLRYQFLSQLETFEKHSSSDFDKMFKEDLVELGFEVIKEY